MASEQEGVDLRNETSKILDEVLEALRPFALLGWALGPRNIHFPHMETIHRPMHVAGRDGRLVEVTGAQALTAYEVWCKANPGQEP